MAGRSIRRVSDSSSDEDDRLGTGNFKPATTPNVPACQHIVNPDQIVPRLLKPRPVLLVRASRQLWLLGALQPADIILGPLAAVRTTVRCLLYFFLLVEKIAFVHKIFTQVPQPGLRKAHAGIENCKFPSRGRRSSENLGRNARRR